MRPVIFYYAMVAICIQMLCVQLNGITGVPGYLFHCDVSTDLDGNFLVWGSYVNDLEFGDSILSSDDYVSSFVAKLGGDGKWIWVRDFPCEHPYYALSEDIMVWQESDGSIGVTGSFKWEKPYGKYLDIKSEEKVSLVYLDRDGQLISLDEGFLNSQNREGPKRPEAVTYTTNEYGGIVFDHHKPLPEFIFSGGFMFSFSEQLIRCVDLHSGIERDIAFFAVNPDPDNYNDLLIGLVAPLPDGKIVLAVACEGEQMQIGNKLINLPPSRYLSCWLVCINSEGELEWITPLNHRFYDVPFSSSLYGEYELLASSKGLLLFTGNDLAEMHHWSRNAAMQLFKCYNAEGRELWTIELGTDLHFVEYGSNVTVKDSGNFFYNDGIKVLGGLKDYTEEIQLPSMVRFDGHGNVLERLDNFETPYRRYASENENMNNDLFTIGTDIRNVNSETIRNVKGTGNSFIGGKGADGDLIWLLRFDYNGTVGLRMQTDLKGNAHILGSIRKGDFRVGAKKITNPSKSEQLVIISVDPHGNCTSIKTLASLYDCTLIYQELILFEHIKQDNKLYVAYTEDKEHPNSKASTDCLWLIRIDPSTGNTTKKSYELPDVWGYIELEPGTGGVMFVSAVKPDHDLWDGNYYDGYTLALNGSLELIWKKEITGDMSAGKNGELFLVGRFHTVIDIDGHILIDASSTYGDIFVCKITTKGKIEWLKHAYDFGGEILHDGIIKEASSYDFWKPWKPEDTPDEY